MSRKDATQMRLEVLTNEYQVLEKDAIILDCIDEFIKGYFYFITDVLNTDKNQNNKEYETSLNIQDYFKEKMKLKSLLTNISTATRNAHLVVHQTYAGKIDGFKKDIDGFNMTGQKDIVFNFGNSIMDFAQELGDIIKSGKPEKMLDVYMMASEERAQRLWSKGIRSLADKQESTMLLYWLVKYGRGVALTVQQIALQIGKSENYVEIHLREIRQLAGELLAYTQVTTDKTAYYVPTAFHGFYLGD